MDKEKAILNSLQFDRAFLDRIKFVEKQKRMAKGLHGNGVPFHYISVFKILCLSRNEDFSTEKISNTYRELFGSGIMQSSLSRTLKYLSKTLGLLDYVDNPHGDVRLTWVKLTSEGKKLQKMFVGSTSEGIKYSAEVKSIIHMAGRRIS